MCHLENTSFYETKYDIPIALVFSKGSSINLEFNLKKASKMEWLLEENGQTGAGTVCCWQRMELGQGRNLTGGEERAEKYE